MSPLTRQGRADRVYNEILARCPDGNVPRGVADLLLGVCGKKPLADFMDAGEMTVSPSGTVAAEALVQRMGYVRPRSVAERARRRRWWRWW